MKVLLTKSLQTLHLSYQRMPRRPLRDIEDRLRWLLNGKETYHPRNLKVFATDEAGLNKLIALCSDLSKVVELRFEFTVLPYHVRYNTGENSEKGDADHDFHSIL